MTNYKGYFQASKGWLEKYLDRNNLKMYMDYLKRRGRILMETIAEKFIVVLRGVQSGNEGVKEEFNGGEEGLFGGFSVRENNYSYQESVRISPTRRGFGMVEEDLYCQNIYLVDEFEQNSVRKCQEENENDKNLVFEYNFFNLVQLNNEERPFCNEMSSDF